MQLINPGLNSSVTIRQLLAHESGYSDYTDEYMLQVSVAFQPARVWNAFETISFCHQINVPGAERQYSSTNYIMLGAIIETVTGKPMEQHYRERFFDKLGFTSMYLGGRESQNGHGELAAPHDNLSMFNPVFQMTGQPTFPDAYTNITRFPLDAIVSLAFSGGGIVSNAAELAEWRNALFGGRATSASTLQAMVNSIPATSDEDGDYLGYGIWTNKKISTTDYFVGHNGSAIGYRSLMMYQPDRKMTIALVTNYAGCNPYLIEKALYEALPNFICGNDNRKEWKILLCYKGKDICVAREAAPVHINKGAYLGSCSMELPAVQTSGTNSSIDQTNEETAFTAYPNPFSNQVTIQLKASKSGVVSLNLYDLNGKLVKHLFTGNMQEGTMKQVILQSNGLPAGTYICRLQTNAGISNRRLILNK
ncbi:MAG: serine hydrolase [Chitinophagaceae bacterium]|nr:serine hydrolase [Chitinophagaceae bacterium]